MAKEAQYLRGGNISPREIFIWQNIWQNELRRQFIARGTKQIVQPLKTHMDTIEDICSQIKF